MTASRRRAASILARITLALTLFALLASAASLASRQPTASGLLDKAVFLALWGYLLGVPVTGVAAVGLGNRQSPLIRSVVGLLVLWLITAVALSTLHF